MAAILRLGLLAALMLRSGPLLAQGVPLRFERYSVDDGLPQSTATAIYQDHKGFLWIGTQDGLGRFDGYEFTNLFHVPGDPGSLSSSRITAIYEDSSQHLWIGTTAGLDRLAATDPVTLDLTGARTEVSGSESDRGEGFQRINLQPRVGADPSSLQVRAIVEDLDGALWVGTDGGLLRVDRDSGAFEGVPLGPEPYPARALLVDSSGSLWAGTVQGLWKKERGSLRFQEVRIGGEGEPSVRGIAALQLGPAGTIWIGSAAGIFRIDPLRGFAVPVDFTTAAGVPPPRQPVANLLVDQAGVLWVGRGFDGLFRLDRESGRFDSYLHDPGDPASMPQGEITSLFEDRSGIIWVGTGRGGFAQVMSEDRQFAHIRHDPLHPTGLSHNYITGISSGPGDILWVGTGGGGLNRIDRTSGTSEVYGDNPSAPGYPELQSVFEVNVDGDGNVWTTSGQDLHRVTTNPFSLESYRPDTVGVGPLESASSTIYEDPAGLVWVVYRTQEDRRWLYRFDPVREVFVSAHPLPELGPTSVQGITPDRYGLLWLATNGGGLVVVDTAGPTLEEFRHDPLDPGSLSHDQVQHVLEDRAGRLWIGTRGGGLNLFRREDGSFRHFRQADGLANDVVYGILEDDAGFLWLSTNGGLSRFDPDREEFLNFDVTDGLQSNEFNRWAFERMDDGTLVFGGVNGLTLFYPSRLTGNAVPPTVGISAIRVRNRLVAGGPSSAHVASLVLPYDENVVSFDFVALHMANPQRNQVRYRLEGLDETWAPSGPKGTARYANLSPGRYTFRVEAANSDGVWSQNAVVLPILIGPPFWQTPWFLLLVATLTVAVLYSGHRYRLSHLLNQERMRTRIARDLHDDVSATLSGISYFAHAIRGIDHREEPRVAVRFLDLIDRSASEARDHISDIIWAIDPEHDSWESLLSRLRRHASDLLGSHDIEHEIIIPEALNLKVLDAEQRRCLWLVYKEVLVNVARHSEATRVRVHLIAKGGQVRLQISDDGKGFDPAQGTEGSGLRNIRERMEELGGEALLEVERGQGTSWTLEFRP